MSRPRHAESNNGRAARDTADRPKAFIRASLWAPSTWSDPQRLPSFAQMLWDQMPSSHSSDASAEEYESKQHKLIRDALY